MTKKPKKERTFLAAFNKDGSLQTHGDGFKYPAIYEMEKDAKREALWNYPNRELDIRRVKIVEVRK